ncbi:MAG: amino acid permease [Acidobacteria bacterium]|nr:amino acid permease [Acidobacteriota bacterium]
MNAAPSRDDRFIKALGLWDVVGMSVVGIVGLRWIARGARIGAPSIMLWLLAGLAFFLPLAAAVIHLSSRYPDQGGLYAWARRAFGPLHGFLCAWCLWVNNLFYFPSLLLFAAANALLVFGDRFEHLTEDRWYSTVFVLTALWMCVGLNVVGLTAGKWLQNLGGIATWIPAAMLIGFGAAAFATFGSATSFAPAALVPQDDILTTVSLWSAMCFAFGGFELSSFVGQEVREPRRTIPRGVLISGAIVVSIYVLGSTSVLVAVPASALQERSGIVDAIALVSERIGLAGMGALIGALLAIGSFAGTSSWFAGSGRVQFAAGEDRVLPASFGRLHPKFRTPHVALLVQGLISSIIFLASVFLTITGSRTTVQEAYDILVNLTILIYFVPYLYLFVALIRLQRLEPEPARSDAMSIPGGRTGLWSVAGVGFTATAISLALVFIPPAGTTNVPNYEANLVGQALIVLLVGLGLFWNARRRR